MKINWKEVSQSTGYKSLKARYIKDLQSAEATRRRGGRPMRGKKEFYQQFTKIINRAIHYAHHEGVTLDVILERWEKHQGGSWWMNYISIPRHTGNSLKQKGINGIKKYYKQDCWWNRGKSKQQQKNAVCSELMRLDRVKAKQRRKETGKKARWSNARKRRGY